MFGLGMTPLIDIRTQWVPLSADIDKRSDSEAGDGTLLHATVSCRRTSERSASPWSDCRELCSWDSASLVAERVRSLRTVAMASIQTAQRLCTVGPGLTEAE